LKNTKNNPIKEQNINSNKTFLFKNVLNLIEAPQDINSIEMLSVRNKFRDKYLDSILNSIGYI